MEKEILLPKEEIKQANKIIDLINNNKVYLYSIYHDANWTTNQRKKNYNKVSYLLQQVLDCFYKLAHLHYYDEAYELGLKILNVQILTLENIARDQMFFKEAIEVERLPFDYKRFFFTLLQVTYFQAEDLYTRINNIYKIYEQNNLNQFIKSFKVPEVSLMEFITLLRDDEVNKELFLSYFSDFLKTTESPLAEFLKYQSDLLQMDQDERIKKINENPHQDLQVTLFVLQNDFPYFNEVLDFYEQNRNPDGRADKEKYEISRFINDSIKSNSGIFYMKRDFWFNQSLLDLHATSFNLFSLFKLVLASSPKEREDLFQVAKDNLTKAAYNFTFDASLLPTHLLFLNYYDDIEEFLNNEPVEYFDLNNYLVAILIFFLFSNNEMNSPGYDNLIELLSDPFSLNSLVNILETTPGEFGVLTVEELTEKVKENLTKWKLRRPRISKSKSKSLIKKSLPFYEKMLETFLDRDYPYEYESTAKYLVAADDVLFFNKINKNKGNYIKKFLKDHQINPKFKEVVDKVVSNYNESK